MKITFLGTAGSLMSNKRSYPSILLNNNLIIDFGEGTTQKLIQINSVESIKVICISHLHNDHFLGIISFLWHLGIKKHKKELEIIGPCGIKNTLEQILKLVNTPDDLISYDISFTELSDNNVSFKRGNYEIDCFKVNHEIIAYAFRVKSKNKLICYTGDTRPVMTLRNFFNNCDLLISESTFPAHFENVAHKYFHMTSEDAVKLAIASSAKKLVLFHISSYFQDQFEAIKIQAEKLFDKDVIIAEDLMELIL